MPEKEERIQEMKAKAYDRIAKEIMDMIEYTPSSDVLVLSGMVMAFNFGIEEEINE